MCKMNPGLREFDYGFFKAKAFSLLKTVVSSPNSLCRLKVAILLFHYIVYLLHISLEVSL